MIARSAEEALAIQQQADPNRPTVGKRSTQWRRRLPALESDRVVLRELRMSDAPSLVAHLSCEQVQRFITPPPGTVPRFEKFIRWAKRERRAGRYLCYGVVPGGHDRPVAVIQLWPLDPGFFVAEWGFAFGAAFWGTGLFQESARLVIQFAFDALGVQRLEARAALENGRGNGALQKVGAVKEGVLRKCFPCEGVPTDHVMWSILADEWRRAHGSPEGRRH